MKFLFQRCLAFGLIFALPALLCAASPLTPGLLPLWFEPVGDNATPDQFIAKGRDSEITLASDGARFSLVTATKVVRQASMTFPGASSAAQLAGTLKLDARINYFSGSDPATWRSALAVFGQVQVADLYPGINLRYYGNQQHLEYDFDVAPGARPEQIRLRFSGVDRVLINARGELEVQVAGRDMLQEPPVASQEVAGETRAVPVSFKLIDTHTAVFVVGSYDHRRPLVIDPVLSYSTFFGGNNSGFAWAIALGTNDDSIYLAGQTLATASSGTNAFSTPGALQTNFQGGPLSGDAFVAKFHDLGTNPVVLNNLATNLIYCTYLGGSDSDAAFALAVDAQGNAFVGGTTTSTNFPVKNALRSGQYVGTNMSGVYDKNFNEIPNDCFITEIAAGGSNLVYSTYLGGESFDAVFGLAIDAADDCFITGETFSTNFPVTDGSHFASVNNFTLGCNAFVAEIAPGGGTLSYSSYLGGTNVDVGYAIACNNSYVAVVGSTCSSNFPTTNALSQLVSPTNYYNGSLLNGTNNNYNNNLVIAPFVSDAFVTLYPTAGSSLGSPLYSTFLGGTNSDLAYGVAVDPAGDVYVVGATTSTNFPNTYNPGQVVLPSFVRTNNAGVFLTNAFISEITLDTSVSPATPTLAYSQMFGGFGNDIAHNLTLDASGNIFIVGSTSAYTNFSGLTNNLIGSLVPTNAGLTDVLIVALQAGFSNLLYSGDFGSVDDDIGYGVAVDSQDAVYITGETLGVGTGGNPFPLFNARQPVAVVAENAFLAKILPSSTYLPVLTSAHGTTNTTVSWSAEPLAQINTNTFFLQTTSNLLSTVVITNIVYQTNVPPFTTNIVVETNVVPSTNWIAVSQKPASTNLFLNGYTNQIYTYSFNPTNHQVFFHLKQFVY